MRTAACRTDDAAVHAVGLRLAGWRVVVVGGGEAAYRGIAGLLDAGADVTVVSPTVTPAVEALAGSAAVTWLPRPYAPGDLDAAWYALAATGDPAVDAAVAGEAERQRVFCTRADGGERSSALLPDLTADGDVVVAVHGAGGPLPGLSGAVHAGLGVGGQCPPAEGRVVLVGGGPGDPGLITVRGMQALARADVVVADHLAPRSLLAALRPGVEVVDASKLPRGRAMPQEEINALLVSHARAGRRVVRLKGGDPFVFGRGMEEVLACVAADVPVDVVPGVTSAVGVPAVAGIPVTHRGLTHEFVVVSGHLPPGHPQSLVDWPAIGRLRGTVVVLMGVENAAAVAGALIDGGRRPGTPVAVVSDGTTPGGSTVRTTLEDLGATILAEDVRPPAVLVVGDVVHVAAGQPATAGASAAG